MTTSQTNPEPVEQLLTDALQRLDPGPAPARLRQRVLEVSAISPAGGRTGWGLRQGIEAVLGVAAAVLLAVIGFTVFNGLSVAQNVAGPVPSAGQSAAPSPSIIPFDQLTLVGPGMLAPTSSEGPGIAVFAVIVVLALLAVTLRGRRRLIPAAGAVVVTAWALVATLTPVTVSINGFAHALNVEPALPVAGSSESLYYEIAPPSSLFVVGTGWQAESLLPVRFEGFVDRQFGRHGQFIGVQWQGAWLDAAPPGGTSGADRPFAPFDLQPMGPFVWLAGRSGICALGPAFDPAHPSNAEMWTSPAMFDVVVSVLGWPRVIHVEPPFRLVEPGPANCSGDPVPGASPVP
jgi:hypothetical protein